MKKTLSFALCLTMIFSVLFFSGCASKPWPVGEWTLSYVYDGHNSAVMVDRFENEVFDFGDSLSPEDLQRAAGRVYVKKLTLNEDGKGTVEYRNAFGLHTEECTWHEFQGSLEIIFNSRTQFKFEGDRRSMQIEIKESIPLDSGFTMTSVVYTLKYTKK